jgi:hypothetical protein
MIRGLVGGLSTPGGGPLSGSGSKGPGFLCSLGVLTSTNPDPEGGPYELLGAEGGAPYEELGGNGGGP